MQYLARSAASKSRRTYAGYGLASVQFYGLCLASRAPSRSMTATLEGLRVQSEGLQVELGTIVSGRRTGGRDPV